MVITRHGEGTFKVQTGGFSLVVDPVDQRLKADVVLRSTAKLPLPDTPSSSTELLGPGEYDIKKIKINGFPASAAGGDGKILETVYEVKAEGLSLVFLGSPKKVPDITIRERLGDIDIVFAPPGSAPFVKQLEPSITVPTHVKNAKAADKELGQSIENVDKLTIKKKDMPAQPIVTFIDA